MLICPAAMLTNTMVMKCGLTRLYPFSRKVVPTSVMYSIPTIPVPKATPEKVNNGYEYKNVKIV